MWWVEVLEQECILCLFPQKHCCYILWVASWIFGLIRETGGWGGVSDCPSARGWLARYVCMIYREQVPWTRQPSTIALHVHSSISCRVHSITVICHVTSRNISGNIQPHVTRTTALGPLGSLLPPINHLVYVMFIDLCYFWTFLCKKWLIAQIYKKDHHYIIKILFTM